MKKKLQKISMVLVATTIFIGALFLSLEKNGKGQWEFATVSSFADGESDGDGGGENNSIVQFFHYNLKTITEGVPKFANGLAHVFPVPGTNPGVATVTVASYTFRSVLYTKTSDGSGVGTGAPGDYNITYKADYTTSGLTAGTITILDSFLETL